MLIAVTSAGRGLNDAVTAHFDAPGWLLIVETDDMSVDAVENTGCGTDDAARLIVERDCEAVITGAFTPEQFNIIADACITRYNGYGHTVREALARMESNTLENIRYASEEDTCHGEHGGGECDCGGDE